MGEDKMDPFRDSAYSISSVSSSYYSSSSSYSFVLASLIDYLQLSRIMLIYSVVYIIIILLDLVGITVYYVPHTYILSCCDVTLLFLRPIFVCIDIDSGFLLSKANKH